MEMIFPVLSVLAAIILLYILWCFTEPFFLDLDRAFLKKSSKTSVPAEEVSVRKIPYINKNNIENIDLRFFFFSDIHAEWCPVTSKRLCNAIRKAHGNKPLDAVIFGGDIVTHFKNASLGYRYLKKVSECCKDLGIPFYGVSGNHDWALETAPEAAGFFSLDNRVIDLVSHRTGNKVKLAGISDSGKKHRIWHQMPDCGEDSPVILVVHDPDAFLHLDPDKRPDIMLSGHLHGGQMKFPFKIEFTVLRKSDKLPNMGAVQGIYDISGTTVFISRGLGCGILPFRFLSLPEATVVEICL